MVHASPVEHNTVALRVGVFDNYPIVFKNKEGNIRGIAIDTLEQVAKQHGWQLHYEHNAWSNVFNRTRTGELDLLVGIAYTQERTQDFQFTQETLISNWAVVYQSEQGTLDSVLELANKSVALMEKSVHTTVFLDNMKQFDIPVVPVFVADYASALKAVQQGRAQAAVVNRVFSMTKIKSFRVKPTNIIFNPVEVRFAEPRSGPGKVVQAIDAYLQQAKKDAESPYFQSLDHWLPGLESSSRKVWYWVIYIITGVVVGLAIYSYSIRRVVKRRTAQLEQSERRFRQLAENVNEVFWIVSPDWQQIFYISPAYERIWGLPCDSLRQSPLSWLEQVHPDDRSKVQNVINRKVDGQARDSRFPEYRIIRPDGEIRWILTRVYPVKGNTPEKVEYVVGYASDITEFKKTEQALFRSEQRYALAQKAAKIGSWEWDIQSGEVYWSDTIEPIFGLGPGKFGGSYEDYLQLIHPEDVEKVVNAINTALENKSHYIIEHRVIWPNGQIHWLAGNGEIKTDTNGNAVKMFGTVQEITERKHAEDALEKALDHLQTLYLASPDLIFLHTPEGEIIDVNDNAAKFLGYNRQELLSLSLAEFFGKDHKMEEAQKLIQRALTGEAVDFEWMVRIRNGKELPVEVRLRRLRDEDHQDDTTLVAIVRDISQRKRVDEVMGHLARSVPHIELEDFLKQAVRQLASVYQCHYAFIGQLISPEKTHVRTLAVWDRDHYAENFTYALQGTPCQEIMNSKIEIIPKDAWHQYPNDPMLKKMQVESYYGAPLISSKGDVLGLVSLMNDSPMDQSTWSAPVLNVHAARFANELERAQASSELHARDDRLRRQQQALRDLSKEQAVAEDKLETALRDTTEITAQALAVDRVSIWLYTDSGDAIRCIDLYERENKIHSEGSILELKDNPAYFRAIEEDRVIAANDAINAAETRDFSDHYLRPQGIASMMDAPIRRGRKIIGVLCNEHIGSVRYWTVDEQNFASSVADIISMTLELWEHKKTTEKLRQHRELLEDKVVERTRELAAVNQELEAFAYSVSHDLRAPLRAVDGFALMLAEDYTDKLDRQAQDYLRRMRAASQRMGELIEALLNLSRLTRSRLNPRDTDLTTIAQEIVHTLSESDKQHKVDVNILPDMRAYGDTAMLHIVMQNLIDNAWKYSRHTPNPKVEVGMNNDKGETVYFVRDNGAGFDPAHSNNMFGAFQRLHRQDEFEGIGIGLATVQRIIHRHGGQVWAESSPGQGAVFYFTLADNRKQSLH
ncbi:PAS domain S-box protein [Kaarinaea lacus]